MPVPAGAIVEFLFKRSRSAMARRTLNLSQHVVQLVFELAEDGESFSAAASRLIQAGARVAGTKKRPRDVASGEGAPDLGRMAERYLRETVPAR
jgi:hypothetical protein